MTEEEQPVSMELESLKDARAAGEEIHALRKYIVEMMHFEMELMEKIKQNEESVSFLDGEIVQYQHCIREEQQRCSTLQRNFVSDVRDLDLLEEKKIVIGAKRDQLQDLVHRTGKDVKDVQAKFRMLHSQILAMSRQCENSSEQLKLLDTTEDDLNLRLLQAQQRTNVDVISSIRQDLHKSRAKKRYVGQHCASLDDEANSLSEKREQLQARAHELLDLISKTGATLAREQEESDLRRTRVREDALRIKKENERLSVKLKAKRKKFRTMTRNENATLRRRIHFVGSELEGIQMSNEDTAATAMRLHLQRFDAEKDLQNVCDQIRATEDQTAEMRDKIANFDRCEDQFDTSQMQQELHGLRLAFQNAQAEVERKEQLLIAAQAEHEKLSLNVERLEKDICSLNIEELDEDLATVNAQVQSINEEGAQLEARVVERSKSCEKMRKLINTRQSMILDLKKQIGVLEPKMKNLEQHHQDIQAHIALNEQLNRHFDELLDVARDYEAGIAAMTAEMQETEQTLKLEYQQIEQQYKKRCMEAELSLKKELDAWNAKIKEVQGQIVAL